MSGFEKIKNTVGKLKTELLYQDLVLSLEEVVKVLEFGLGKYDRASYKKLNTKEGKEALISAMQRHINKYIAGEQSANDSNLNHMAHLATSALFLTYFDLKDNDYYNLVQPPKDLVYNNPQCLEEYFKPKAIICDLDGTFFDNTLDKYLPSDKTNRQSWDDIVNHYAECICNKNIVDLLNNYIDKDYIIIFLTAREDRKKARELTNYSILTSNLKQKAGINLLMRQENDYRTDSQVKYDIYHTCIKDYYDVELVIDDKFDNLVVFDKLGLKTQHPNFITDLVEL